MPPASGVPRLVDHPGDPDAKVEAQAAETAFQQHVAAEKVIAAAVHGAHDPGVGELVLAHQTERDLRRPAALRQPGGLAADDGSNGVDVPTGSCSRPCSP